MQLGKWSEIMSMILLWMKLSRLLNQPWKYPSNLMNLRKKALVASQEANKITERSFAESKRSYSVNIAILIVSSIALVVSIATLLLSI